MKDKKKRKLELRSEEEGKEFRRFPLEELRVVREDGEAPKIEGHAALFNKWSEDLGGFREKIRPGAFSKSIKSDDVRALWNHNSDFVLGRNTNGTLALQEDKRGLKVEIDPPDTQWARDFLVSIERGDVSQMSFGFYTIEDDWRYPDKPNALAERELVEAQIFDVSPVTYPAYPQTSVSVRSAFPDIDLVMAKVDSGEELTDDDRAVVQTAIDALSSLEPVPEDGEGEDTAPVAQDLTALKTLLEIEQEMGQ